MSQVVRLPRGHGYIVVKVHGQGQQTKSKFGLLQSHVKETAPDCSEALVSCDDTFFELPVMDMATSNTFFT